VSKSAFLKRAIIYYLENNCVHLCPLIKSGDFPGTESQRLWLYGRILNRVSADNLKHIDEGWTELTSLSFRVPLRDTPSEDINWSYHSYLEKQERVNFLLKLFYKELERESEEKIFLLKEATRLESEAREHTPRTIREMIFGVKERKQQDTSINPCQAILVDDRLFEREDLSGSPPEQANSSEQSGAAYTDDIRTSGVNVTNPFSATKRIP
jgi:hypothetical protein